MTRHLLFYALAYLLLLALPLSSRAAVEHPFGIQVLDEATHRGVPLAVLESPDHVRYLTDSAGWIALSEPGLQRRRVHFTLHCAGYTFAKDSSGEAAITLDIVPGGTTEISAIRTDIAQRIYRTTGLGIYRDTTFLGQDAPLPRPNINAGVIAQQGIQTALYEGKIFWAWTTTTLASHAKPLAQGVGAFSELPTGKGLDPSQGIHYDYLCGSDQEPTALIPCDEPGIITLDGLATVPDAQGSQHLVAHYVRRLNEVSIAEHGLAEYNASTHIMERLVVLGSDYAWQFPQGHVLRVSENQLDFLYFATPLCHTRCPATYEALQNPASYEALAFVPETKQLAWQSSQPPLTQTEEAKLIASKKLPAARANSQLIDVISRKPLSLLSGTVQWNAYRKCFVMLASARLSPTEAGGLWYAEAPSISGPWQKAIRIASLGSAQFTQPCHHAFFDQKDGQLLYCEGSYSSTSGAPNLYDNNQLMYLIDLADERLKALTE